MHKHNETAYQNPELRAFEDKRAVVAVDTSLADNAATAGKIPGNSESVIRLNRNITVIEIAWLVIIHLNSVINILQSLWCYYTLLFTHNSL